MYDPRTSKHVARGLTALIIAALISGCSYQSASQARTSSRTQQIVARRLETCLDQTDVDAPVEKQSHHVSQNSTAATEQITWMLAADDETNASLRESADTSEQAHADTEQPFEPSFSATVKRDVKNLPDDLWDDTKAVFGNKWNWVFLLSAGGASAALRPEVDDDIEDHFDKQHAMSEDWRDAFGAAGNPATHFALAGAWYLAGHQLEDGHTFEVGRQMISALTISGVTTTLLKFAACTDAPNGESLAWPSGHVSSTMTMATVLNDAYGPLVGVPMFGLTGLVALERLDSGEHHFSDVVFGAALGWLVAETVVQDERPELLGGQLVPYVAPESSHAGIAWVRNITPSQ